MGFPTEHRPIFAKCISSRPPKLSPFRSLYSFFIPTVRSPGDIWISTADHNMVTAPAFMILRREVASSSRKVTDV